MEHCLRPKSPSLADFRQPIIADHQLAIRVLPPKGTLDLVALPIQEAIKPPKFLRNLDGLFRMAPMRVDHRFHLLVFDGVPVRLGVKARIQRQS